MSKSSHRGVAIIVAAWNLLVVADMRAETPKARTVRPLTELLYSVDPAPPAMPTGFVWRLQVAADGCVDLGRHGTVKVAGMTFDQAKSAIDRQIGLIHKFESTADHGKYAERLQQLRKLATATRSMPEPMIDSPACETTASAAYVIPTSAREVSLPQPSMTEKLMRQFKPWPATVTSESSTETPAKDTKMVRLSKGRSAPMPAPSSTPKSDAKVANRPELIRASAQEAVPAERAAPQVEKLPAPSKIQLSKGRTASAPAPELAPEPMPMGPMAPHECATVSLPPYVIHPPDILLIESTRSLRDQPIRGQHLVRPDGTIGLGIYGSAYVAGMTLEQARSIVAHEISKRVNDFDARDLSIDVLAYNSKVYYVITDGGGYGEQVYRLPITGYETVLDALSQINGLPPVASKSHIWVARACAAAPCGQMILPVDWKGIACDGLPNTNYQIFPGDRVYVKADKFITIDSYLAKVLSPIERLMGTTLLGATTYNSIVGRGFGF